MKTIIRLRRRDGVVQRYRIKRRSWDDIRKAQKEELEELKSQRPKRAGRPRKKKDEWGQFIASIKDDPMRHATPRGQTDVEINAWFGVPQKKDKKFKLKPAKPLTEERKAKLMKDYEAWQALQRRKKHSGDLV